MTEQRNLKKLVRDRAARTGESYMTAHRQVTGRSTAHTAPGATRPLYAAYLTEAAPLLGGDAEAVLDAAGHLAQAGAVWSTIARLAREPDASARLAELAAAVDEARSLEVRAVEALAAV
jgi:Domain of unknown function (DUF4872)